MAIITGNDDDNFLNGTAGFDSMTGGLGNDTLSGRDGDDVLFGGDGGDRLYGGQGANTLQGGTGDDLYFVQSNSNANNLIVDTDGTADILQVLDTADRDAFRLVFDGTTLVHETMQGHRTTIGLDSNGTPVIEYLQWMGSELFGTPDYKNTLRIITDLTQITGTLLAVAGTDGADIIVMPNEKPEQGEYWGEVYANAGSDTITLSSTLQYITYGGTGNDTVSGVGFIGDFIDGEQGNDVLFGGGGADSLFGGSGSDKLGGGNGDDHLYAGTGKDRLTGNGGADHFVFSSTGEMGLGQTRDIITDFRSGTDKIDLSAFGEGLTFIGNVAFSGAAGEVRFDAVKGQLQVDLDGGGLDGAVELTNGSVQAQDLLF